jgi:hypothetical protein
MNLLHVVAAICHLPVRFKVRNSASMLTLVEESGYRAAPDLLSVDVVSAYLAERPSLVDAWLKYSQDKRTSSGWYVTEQSTGTCEVGYYPNGERVSVYGRVPACAEFIVREVRAIGGRREPSDQ